jgi:hypothetical protein
MPVIRPRRNSVLWRRVAPTMAIVTCKKVASVDAVDVVKAEVNRTKSAGQSNGCGLYQKPVRHRSK